MPPSPLAPPEVGQAHARSYFFSNSPVRWRFTNVVLPGHTHQDVERRLLSVGWTATRPGRGNDARAGSPGTATRRCTGGRPAQGAPARGCPGKVPCHKQCGGGPAPPLWPPGLLGWGARACAAVAHQDELEAGHVCGAGRAHSGPFQATDVRKRGANALSGTFMPGSAMATGPHYVWGLLHTRLKRWKGAQGHTGERAGEARQGGCRRGASTHAGLLAETLVCRATPWLPTRRPVQLERRWWPCRRSFPPTPTRMPPSAARTPQTRPPWTPSTGTCQQSRCHTHSCLACGDASPG